MNKKQLEALREQIAKGFNHGLNNSEVYATLGKHDECTYPADLIAVIRDLMDERKGE